MTTATPGTFPVEALKQTNIPPGINQPGTMAQAPGTLLTLPQIQQAYPCTNCKAPCCSYLPLHTFNISNIRELDHALYLLNFPRIELGLSATGEWSVYYRYPCRFLNREKGNCNIYEDPMRPAICANYSPYACWYKRVIGPNVHATFLRINKSRMDALTEHLIFDEDHNLVGIPDWATMSAMFENLPIGEQFDEGVEEEDPIFDRWLYEAAYDTTKNTEEPKINTYTSLLNPCANCGASCCKYLIFPQAAPTTRVNLDYLQFVLGFPGIEIGVTDGDWFVIVKASCRHLVENKCSIFGKPERPQICTFYDAHGCQYVAQFGVPKPKDFMRVKLEQFNWLVEPLGFDDYGNVTMMPDTETLRQHIEQKWAEAVNVQHQLSLLKE